jgi:hypothetical protein
VQHSLTDDTTQAMIPLPPSPNIITQRNFLTGSFRSDLTHRNAATVVKWTLSVGPLDPVC